MQEVYGTGWSAPVVLERLFPLVALSGDLPYWADFWIGGRDNGWVRRRKNDVQQPQVGRIPISKSPSWQRISTIPCVSRLVAILAEVEELIDTTWHIDHQPMDVDNDDVERFFPGHYPLPVHRYHAAQADQDTIEREFIPDITFGIATIDLNPFDQREQSVEVPTTPPVFLFPSTNLFTAQQTYNASTTATYYTDNTTNGSGNAFGQHDSGTTRGAWTTQQGFQGVGDTPWYITGTSSAIAQNDVALQMNGLGNAYAVAENGQSALTPPATSWSSGAQVTTGHNANSNTTQRATYSHLVARPIPRPASDGNVRTSNNGFTGTATNGAGLPPMTLLPGAADPPRNPEWAVLVWPRSLRDQASRWMYATENHIRQTAIQLATAISRAEGIAIGEARAAEALAAEREEIERISWSAGFEAGQREARDGEEAAIAEAVEEERARQRELLEQTVSRTRTEAFDRGVETTRRAAEEQLGQQQRTIDDLRQRLTRATQDSGAAHRQMETIIAQQRARIEQVEHDAATARAQAEQAERRRLEQAQAAEQRRLEHAQEVQELRAQRDTVEEQRREQALDADVVRMELETALQASAGQAQIITDLQRDLGTAQNAQREQTNRNHILEQERASLQAQIAALRQERDDLQAELAQERAGRRLARQPETGNIPGLDQDASMEAQEPQGIAAPVLDDAALREALSTRAMCLNGTERRSFSRCVSPCAKFLSKAMAFSSTTTSTLLRRGASSLTRSPETTGFATSSERSASTGYATLYAKMGSRMKSS